MADALMLGVSGMRGVVGSTLTPEVVTRFAGAYGTWLVERHKGRGRPRVVLGRDGRAGGHMVRDAAAAGLTAAGCDVLDLGIAMTPSVGVCTDALGDGGMVLTASHNPQEWNGLKLLFGEGGSSKKAAAAAPSKAFADELIVRYREGRIRQARWDQIGDEDSDPAGVVSPMHAARVIAAVEKAGAAMSLFRRAKLPVVIDSVNSSGSYLSAILMNALGCRLTHVNADGTGLFPHPPEPIEANLGSLGRAVKKAKAAVGFAQDPDADRLAIVDERGRFIGEEYTLVLAARALIELRVLRAGMRIAVNLSTSRMIDDLAATHGLVVVRTAVGEANVVEAMKQQRGALGGEGNGGVIWPAVTYIRDSLGAMALVLALLLKTRRTVSQLVAEMPAYAIVKRKVDLSAREHAQPAIKAIAAAYRGSQRVDLQDGVRVDFESRSAWVHVRPSNTEPIMRLIAEAPTRPQAEALLDEINRVIRA
jgi:phosphomannomutase